MSSQHETVIVPHAAELPRQAWTRKLQAVDYPSATPATEIMGVEENEQTSDVVIDSLQLFLKDIGKVELLTAAQEVELAKRIERGDHRAKQAMVEANLRLVVSIAKR
jgi:DNA-directed RNA polymerase sigma subunit (sigma70/sigma32)